MLKKKLLLLLFPLLIGIFLGCQPSKLQNQNNIASPLLAFQQIKTDSLFDSHQIISIITLEKKDLNQFQIDIAYSPSDLKTTSSFGKTENAIAAINGTFYDMDKGGSVTYLEKKDSLIHRTRQSGLKWAISNKLKTGAIIIKNDLQIKIEPAQTDSFYEHSKEEAAVMVAAPMLLYNTSKMNLPNMKFVHKRHPRTCLCETKETFQFITIDGRSNNAEGMNLLETQQFLLNQGCINAINLDGGGSTTMWIKDKGIVNNPSDLLGERAVANVILIRRR